MRTAPIATTVNAWHTPNPTTTPSPHTTISVTGIAANPPDGAASTSPHDSKETKVKPYYEDDFVTLYHGDCLEVTEWLEADVLVTDPPYGVGWVSGGTTWYGKDGKIVQQEKKKITADENPAARDFALNLWGDRPAIVFGSWRVARPANTRNRLIWHKLGRNPGPLNAPWYSVDEEIYILGSGFKGKTDPNVYPTSENRTLEPSKIGHPTPKPVGLMEALISKCPDGVIADPFAGSGATLLAARNLGRRAIGVELEEKYCEIAAQRLSQDVLDLEGLTDHPPTPQNTLIV